MTENRYVKITEEEAKNLYCKGKDVYLSTRDRAYWKIPASGCYGSHAPIETLFYRSIPEYEGQVEFFKMEKVYKRESLPKSIMEEIPVLKWI